MYRNLTTALVALATIGVVLSVTSITGTQGATSSGTPTGLSVGNPASSTAEINAAPGTSCHQATIPLGAAGNFAVLAGTTVTNTGATVVHGNLGVSPGSAVTGFPPGKVTGKIDTANTAAANGEAALITAYNNGMGRTNCPVSVAGNIGGKTLSPGLYKSTSSLAISSGDLTLTANGNAKAVFIFQVTTKFTVTSGRQVVLAGGAVASRIFWVVGSSATLGSTAVVYGNILAHKSISLATGATLHGKALANVGAVTLEGNTVTKAATMQGRVATTTETFGLSTLVGRTYL